MTLPPLTTLSGQRNPALNRSPRGDLRVISISPLPPLTTLSGQRNPALNRSPRGDLRVISISPLPPRSGGRCRRQRGAPGAPPPDSGSSPPSLRDTATGREGRSRGTYAQVSSGGDIGKGSDAPEHIGWSGGGSDLFRAFPETLATSQSELVERLRTTAYLGLPGRPADGAESRPVDFGVS